MSEERPGYELSKIPLNTLYRWYMYDLDFPEPNAYAHVFDLTPVSEEGDDKERQDSDLRMDNLASLIPFIRLYASINSNYMYEIQKPTMLAIPGVTEAALQEQSESLKKLYYQITLAGLVSMMSSAIELGIVVTDGTETEVDV